MTISPDFASDRYRADPVTAWAEDVVAGLIIAGPHVRDAAARHLRDLEDGPARGLLWDVDAAKNVIGWFARNLRLNGGQFEGKPFILHPSQAFRVGSLFGWKRAATGLRRFRRFYDEEGKGNGKSPMLGGIGLYLMIADGEARAEVYSAAANKDQARILFADAVAMVEQSPRLSSRVEMQGQNPVWQMSYRGKDGGKRYFKPIANEAKSGGKSGPRPHAALCDEVHEHPNRDTIDLLERGFKFRLQPLLCMATNSGSDRKSICWEEHQHGVRVASGIVEDDTTFAFVCSLDDGDDWENDPSCWVKANPLLGATITEEWLAAQVEQAKKMPGKRNGIARLHFCEWTQAQKAAIKRESWLKCVGKVDLDEMIERGYPCYGGLDLSQTRDFTALTLVWLIDPTRDAERFASHTWFWTPKDTLADRAAVDQTPYDLWERQGFLEAIPGERLKYAWLADAIARINARFAPQAIGCDQYGLERLQEHMTDIGATIPAEIHPQGFQKRVLEKDPKAPEGQQEIYLWMPDSINKLEAAISEERILIDHNPLLDSMAASVVYAENRTGHRMFDKPNAYGRIDGMVSKAMGVGMALCRAPKEAEKKRLNSYFKSLVPT
ncbi:Phage terminase-like protein, large subunit, contains N-terminal HTH domain [Paracoccus laeviglucosivorans]|uniref:Phage terminase-like protein, large subunit, contains N-terminal HTH domain n=2 Tax=Paracoccus laeviglucosivorans TaxID=1197861 RepID=A0A521CX07_9RHOB|nr:Phage terminase-like protein, large subunit, contains N-terminal HTH domain [Paracoccus laeviglucosivorans]